MTSQQTGIRLFKKYSICPHTDVQIISRFAIDIDEIKTVEEYVTGELKDGDTELCIVNTYDGDIHIIEIGFYYLVKEMNAAKLLNLQRSILFTKN